MRRRVWICKRKRMTVNVTFLSRWGGVGSKVQPKIDFG